jgi:N-acetylmuramoyl-L-alanine amidase
MKVYLTAGHQIINGRGNGAHGYGDEAVEAAKLRDALTARLRERGVQVINESNATSLQRVLDWLRASVTERDMVVDIHFNAATNPAAQGTEVLIPNKHTQTELVLARDLAAAISKSINVPLRRGDTIYSGVKTEAASARSSIGILRGPFKAHNVLLEICFITNYKEMTTNYPNGFTALVNNLADVICRYAKA